MLKLAFVGVCLSAAPKPLEAGKEAQVTAAWHSASLFKGVARCTPLLKPVENS
jgi:hypothetical protein